MATQRTTRRSLTVVRSPFPGFASLRAARRFLRGVVNNRRVVADRGPHYWQQSERFVVAAPRTARAQGWTVVS